MPYSTSEKLQQWRDRGGYKYLANYRKNNLENFAEYNRRSRRKKRKLKRDLLLETIKSRVQIVCRAGRTKDIDGNFKVIKKVEDVFIDKTESDYSKFPEHLKERKRKEYKSYFEANVEKERKRKRDCYHKYKVVQKCWA